VADTPGRKRVRRPAPREELGTSSPEGCPQLLNLRSSPSLDWEASRKDVLLLAVVAHLVVRNRTLQRTGRHQGEAGDVCSLPSLGDVLLC